MAANWEKSVSLGTKWNITCLPNLLDNYPEANSDLQVLIPLLAIRNFRTNRIELDRKSPNLRVHVITSVTEFRHLRIANGSLFHLRGFWRLQLQMPTRPLPPIEVRCHEQTCFENVSGASQSISELRVLWKGGRVHVPSRLVHLASA
jgi:hypothetical protein